MEKDFAWITKAKFWRNGDAFRKTDKDKDYYDNAKVNALGAKESVLIIKSLDDIEKIINRLDKDKT